jgi:hypothetical protein
MMPINQKDLTSSEHWSQRYGKIKASGKEWNPDSYCAKVIEKALSEAITLEKPTGILEVGCGNSVWLPYLA